MYSGLNAGFNYKGFNFSMQWSGATNVNKMLQIEYRIPFTNTGKRGLLEYFYKDCWTPENQLGAKYPRAAETSRDMEFRELDSLAARCLLYPPENNLHRIYLLQETFPESHWCQYARFVYKRI